MPTLYIFQHVPYENLGALEPLFLAQGLRVQYIRSYERDLAGLKMADLADAAALVAMGGPMSANDGHRLPFIREELRLIEEALRRNLPYLGICLGSQLLAKVLGARVYPGPEKEIGWYPLEMSAVAEHDPLFRKFPPQLGIFQWHGETFDLPSGATRLASSARYENQAFRHGRAYGVQFHPEMTVGMVEEWIREGEPELAATKLPHSKEQILQAAPEQIKVVEPCLQGLAEGFLSLT